MHVYLLVNVLLLGITVALWCQGKLPHTTPAPRKKKESDGQVTHDVAKKTGTFSSFFCEGGGSFF